MPASLADAGVRAPAARSRAITAARSTLADGCTTTTNPTNASAASPTAARGPTNRALNSTAPQTIVTFAPDTAVRCVSPAARNSASCRADTGGVAEDQSRKHRRLIGGQAPRDAVRERARTRWAARWTARPRRGRLSGRRKHGDSEIAPPRPADPGAECGGPARRQLGEPGDRRENHDPAGHFVAADGLQRPPEHDRPPPSDRGVRWRDDDGDDVAERR